MTVRKPGGQGVARLVAYLVAAGTLVIVIALIIISLGLGDCAPQVSGCGQVGRLMSLALIVCGIGGLVYLVSRFVKGHRADR